MYIILIVFLFSIYLIRYSCLFLVMKGVSEEPWNLEDGLCFRFDKNVFCWEEYVFSLYGYMKPNCSTRADLNDNIARKCW